MGWGEFGIWVFEIEAWRKDLESMHEWNLTVSPLQLRVQIRLAGGGARAMEGDAKLFFEISFDKELL